MLSLDEAIQHCHEKAEELKKEADYLDAPYGMDTSERTDCLECAKEHEQLAEWLTDYKRLLNLEAKIRDIVFSDNTDIGILKIKDMFTGENEE